MMKLVSSVCSNKTTCFQFIHHVSSVLPLLNCVTSPAEGTSPFCFDRIYNPISHHDSNDGLKRIFGGDRRWPTCRTPSDLKNTKCCLTWEVFRVSLTIYIIFSKSATPVRLTGSSRSIPRVWNLSELIKPDCVKDHFPFFPFQTNVAKSSFTVTKKNYCRPWNSLSTKNTEKDDSISPLLLFRLVERVLCLETAAKKL